MTDVSLYLAPGCHLCALAREALVRLRGELGFELTEIDISGRPELERAYRPWIPVVEVGGERVSSYHLDESALRARLAELPPAPSG